MSDFNKKLADFTNMVMGDAGKRRDELLESIEKEKEKRLDSLKKEIEEDAQSEMKRKTENIKKENNERILKTEAQLKKELLIEREDMVKAVMDAVRAKLDAFMETPDYDSWLVAKAKQAVEELGEGEIVVSVGDAKKTAVIESAVKGVKCELSEALVAGGISASNKDKGLYADYSFASLLEEEEESFLQRSGLNI